MKCMLENCDNKTLRNNLCASHYQRWVRHGNNFDKSIIKNIKYDLISRFKMKMSKPDKNGCVNFLGCLQKPNGYGKFMMGSRKTNNKNGYLAHRVSYELFVGIIPKNMYVLHKCDNRSCVNPEHLFLGTQRDNMNDMIKKNRSFHVIPYGSNHGNAKLTEKK